MWVYLKNFNGFLGQIVKHGDIKCVLNEGMPIYRRPYEKGRLIIEFKVSYKILYTWEWLAY